MIRKIEFKFTDVFVPFYSELTVSPRMCCVEISPFGLIELFVVFQISF